VMKIATGHIWKPWKTRLAATWIMRNL
jgi:hypothetical protein